jgi:hypothetical protein
MHASEDDSDVGLHGGDDPDNCPIVYLS